MRIGDKCKEKSTKDDNTRVTDLINNANFLLNVSVSSNQCSQKFSRLLYF